MAIYRAASGANRQVKTITRASGGANRIVREMYRAYGGANRLVFKGLADKIKYKQYNFNDLSVRSSGATSYARSGTGYNFVCYKKFSVKTITLTFTLPSIGSEIVALGFIDPCFEGLGSSTSLLQKYDLASGVYTNSYKYYYVDFASKPSVADLDNWSSNYRWRTNCKASVSGNVLTLEISSAFVSGSQPVNNEDMTFFTGPKLDIYYI